MSTYNRLGGKTLAELPIPPTNLQTTEGTANITVTWDNNNTLGGYNVIQRWDDSTSMWINSGQYASGATSGVTTGATPAVGTYNIRVAVLLNDKYYPSLVTTGNIIENPYPLDGLVARWTFDSENLVDEVSSYDLTAGVNYAGTYYDGLIGKAAYSNVYAGCTVGYNGDAGLKAVFDGSGTWTYSTWLNQGNWGSNRHIIGDINSNDLNQAPFNFAVILKNGTDNYIYRNDWQTKFTMTLNANTWYHIVITCDGTNMSVYQNTVLKATRGGGSVSLSTNIGFGQIAGYDVGQGLMDNSYLYNRVLSAAEIAKLYNSGNGI